jgi:hypothetical protein
VSYPAVPTRQTADFVFRFGSAINHLLNRVAGGYPFPHLDADPSEVNAGYTYYNTTTNKVRTWDGSAWNNHW